MAARRGVAMTVTLEDELSNGQTSVEFARFEDSEIGKHTSELQSHSDLVCRLLLEKKKKYIKKKTKKIKKKTTYTTVENIISPDS